MAAISTAPNRLLASAPASVSVATSVPASASVPTFDYDPAPTLSPNPFYLRKTIPFLKIKPFGGRNGENVEHFIGWVECVLEIDATAYAARLDGEPRAFTSSGRGLILDWGNTSSVPGESPGTAHGGRALRRLHVIYGPQQGTPHPRYVRDPFRLLLGQDGLGFQAPPRSDSAIATSTTRKAMS